MALCHGDLHKQAPRDVPIGDNTSLLQGLALESSQYLSSLCRRNQQLDAAGRNGGGEAEIRLLCRRHFPLSSTNAPISLTVFRSG